eukprot:8171659-Pyramimonas_sp.AAC.1
MALPLRSSTAAANPRGARRKVMADFAPSRGAREQPWLHCARCCYEFEVELTPVSTLIPT